LNNIKSIKILIEQTKINFNNLSKKEGLSFKDGIFIEESIKYLNLYTDINEYEIFVKKDSLKNILKKMNRFIEKINKH
jgi:hypothetical protein